MPRRVSGRRAERSPVIRGDSRLSGFFGSGWTCFAPGPTWHGAARNTPNGLARDEGRGVADRGRLLLFALPYRKRHARTLLRLEGRGPFATGAAVAQLPLVAVEFVDAAHGRSLPPPGKVRLDVNGLRLFRGIERKVPLTHDLVVAR